MKNYEDYLIFTLGSYLKKKLDILRQASNKWSSGSNESKVTYYMLKNNDQQLCWEKMSQRRRKKVVYSRKKFLAKFLSIRLQVFSDIRYTIRAYVIWSLCSRE